MKPTKTLIIHIGTEKTGTTSLQNFLFANSRTLESRGIWYPSDLNKSYCQDSAHFPLGALLTDRWHDIVSQNKVDQFRLSLDAFCSDSVGSSFPVTVISSEHFSSRARDPSRLKAFRSKIASCFDQTRIACYIRRQPDMAVSSYYTSVLYGGRKPFDLSSVSAEDPFFNHLAMLDLWSDSFGSQSMLVREYNKGTLSSGDICSDFCNHMLGIDAAELKKVGEKNASRGAVFTELIRQLNLVLPTVEENVQGWRSAQQIRSIIAANLKINNDIDFSLSQQEEEILIRRFSEINSAVNSRYLGGAMSESWFKSVSSGDDATRRPNDKWITERTLNAMSGLLVELLRPPKRA